MTTTSAPSLPSSGSLVSWTVPGCGVKTVTSATTHTDYLADTTYTTTVYFLTPNQIENGSTYYDLGSSTYETSTEYSANTTGTSTSASTTTYTETESVGCAIVHLNISVTYSGVWNGTYSTGSTDPNSLIPVACGTGSKNVSIAFQGNWEFGFCYSVHVQKDDDSNAVLRVVTTSDYVGSYSNSTSTPFGMVGWGACSIS